MGEHCPVLQVVGYQGSGKTALMEKLIRAAGRRGKQTAALKHHGHGGTKPAPLPGNHKDSSRHKTAGAFVSAVEGNGAFQLEAETGLSLPQILTIYQSFNPDVIFIEGYKQADYPKVVLLRTTEDQSLLRECSKILCVISSVPFEGGWDFPSFSMEDEQDYLDFLLKKMGVDYDHESI